MKLRRLISTVSARAGMGIANFNTYVDKALKWPLSRYDGIRIPEEPDECGVPKSTDATSSGIPPFSAAPVPSDRGSHPDRVFVSIRDNVRSFRCTDERMSTTYGICVDLSSALYGVIADVVSQVRSDRDAYRQERTMVEEDNGVAATADRRVEEVGENGNVFDESVLFETRSVVQRIVTSEVQLCGDNGADRCLQTVLQLDDCVIEECARKCVDRLYDMIGREAINNAHHVTLHYDENTTVCKWYAQYKRRMDSQTILHRDSLCRVFQYTIRSVRTRILSDLKAYLHRRSTESSCTEARVSKLLSDDEGDAYLTKVVDEKMLFYDGGGGFDDCKRYSFGEGEWRCFYCISDVDTKASNTGDNVKNRWYVFGNDSDIGLGALLYSSEMTRAHYVNGSGTVIAPPVEVCARKDWNAYKTLHFLSLCLIGNDYVPRLVNGNTKNITALGNEVDSMLASHDKHCESRVTRLSCVFNSVVAVNERYGENDAVTNRKEFAKAFAYVIVRLLKAVYGTATVQEAADANKEDTKRIGNQRGTDEILLRCNDNKRYTLADCLTVFTTRTLWYLAYCTFYTHLDDGRREALLEAATFMPTTLHLELPGLPMQRCFLYNERRLIDSEQFETTNLADMRQAIKSLTFVQLIRVIESRTLDVLESE